MRMPLDDHRKCAQKHGNVLIARHRADVQRLVTMWSELLVQYKGPMLFGNFSIADAFFAPVCMRLKSYALPVPADITAYIQRVSALPGVKAWIDDALAENDFRDFEEPYRIKR